MGFEGATKKNKPNIVTGDVVYAKIITASKDMEPELVCVDAYGKKAGLGQLTGGGLLFSVPLHLVRKLLSPESELLKKLGQTLKFEIAIGEDYYVLFIIKKRHCTVGNIGNFWLITKF